MDRNTIIGMLLMVLLFFLYVKINAPSPEEIKEQKRIQDSIQQVETERERLDSLNELGLSDNGTEKSRYDQEETQKAIPDDALNDSLRNVQLRTEFGSYADHLSGEEKEITLENDHILVTLSSKGAYVKSVLLKKYNKTILNKEHKELELPLYLLEDDKNRFNFSFSENGRTIGTENLYFKASESSSSVDFTIPTSTGKDFVISYALGDKDYLLDIDISSPYRDKELRLEWMNYMDRIEYNTSYEKMYSTIYYKESDEDSDHCSCTGEDKEVIEDRPLKWVSHANQFFNSTLIAEGTFDDAILEVLPMEEESDDLKLAKTFINFKTNESGKFDMQMYVGPNEFSRLRAMNMEMENIIPFGTSIFGTINRWIIRPVFDFLTSLIGIKGLAIVLLTFLIKLILFPLTFKMLKSQSKMAALKPVLEKLKSKHKDDQQKQQMETMKTYREYGVSPLGGCMPMVLQMPIWFALYRFFPASITFRQASFLWARDLSSYDVIAWLPFEIPFYGDHVSLFTILWAVSLIVYTYYNSRYMDFSSQPAMKYMQYLMPLMFLFYFNNFASGLSCYLFFSNVMNIGQNLITKNYIIDQEKIKNELIKNKDKPKKKGGFQARLEKALKEQQKIAEQNKKKKK
ncbi:MAG TPA: membrane protein insertase YidC [Saprospiraceae bacterium]|nr:membrane protein insertase YidC [Saprospiraceae bacterium]